jgi:hypothetical protein
VDVDLDVDDRPLSRRFRFRPKQPWTAGIACLLGAGLAGASLVNRDWGWALVGASALLLGCLYLLSPAWKTEVVVDGEALEVVRGGERRFRLPWDEVVRLVIARGNRTAFVDGGGPERSLLLPGRGAKAPYRIGDQPALFDAIVARVAPDRVIEVDRLDRPG